MASERTSGGPPHGVYQPSRPSARSNGSTQRNSPSSSRTRCASAVPATTSPAPASTQFSRTSPASATGLP